MAEARLQRLAADNPVATSLVYQRLVDAVFEVLIGLPTACAFTEGPAKGTIQPQV